MKGEITPERIANSIRMLKNSGNELFLILEGKLDCKLYPKYFKEDKTHTVCAFGFERVEKVIDILESENQDNILGIIDADFRRVLKKGYNKNKIFITDFHDVESTLINSEAIDLYLDLAVNKSSIKK